MASSSLRTSVLGCRARVWICDVSSSRGRIDVVFAVVVRGPHTREERSERCGRDRCAIERRASTTQTGAPALIDATTSSLDPRHKQEHPRMRPHSSQCDRVRTACRCSEWRSRCDATPHSVQATPSLPSGFAAARPHS